MSNRALSDIFSSPSASSADPGGDKSRSKSAFESSSTHLNGLEGPCYHSGCPSATHSGRQYCSVHSKESPNITFVDGDSEDFDFSDENNHNKLSKASKTDSKSSLPDFDFEFPEENNSSNAGKSRQNRGNDSGHDQASSKSKHNPDLFSATFFDPPGPSSRENPSPVSSFSPLPNLPQNKAMRKTKSDSSPLLDLFSPPSAAESSSAQQNSQQDDDAAMAQFQAMLYSSKGKSAVFKAAESQDILIPHLAYPEDLHNSTPEKTGTTNYIGIIPWEIPVEFDDGQSITDYSFLYDIGAEDEQKNNELKQTTHIRTASQINLTSLLNSSHEMAALEQQKQLTSNNNTIITPRPANNADNLTVSGSSSPRIVAEVELTSPLGPSASTVTQSVTAKKAKLMTELKLNEKEKKFIEAAIEITQKRASTPNLNNTPRTALSSSAPSARTTPTPLENLADLLHNPVTEDYSSVHSDDLYERIKQLEARNNWLEKELECEENEQELGQNLVSMQRMMAEIIIRMNAVNTRPSSSQKERNSGELSERESTASKSNTGSGGKSQQSSKERDGGSNNSNNALCAGTQQQQPNSAHATKRNKLTSKKYKTLDLSSLVALSNEEFHAQARAFLAAEKQLKLQQEQQQQLLSQNNINSNNNSPAQSVLPGPPQLSPLLPGTLIRATVIPPLNSSSSRPTSKQGTVTSNSSSKRPSASGGDRGSPASGQARTDSRPETPTNSLFATPPAATHGTLQQQRRAAANTGAAVTLAPLQQQPRITVPANDVHHLPLAPSTPTHSNHVVLPPLQQRSKSPAV
jgi:hypothetical protein